MRYLTLLLICGLLCFGFVVAEECGAACPEKGHEVVKTVADASLTGKIQCNHCDLHRADKCQKVLVTEDKKVYQFCPDTLKDVKLTELSGKQVQVKGTVKDLKDADSVIHVTSIQPVS